MTAAAERGFGAGVAGIALGLGRNRNAGRRRGSQIDSDTSSAYLDADLPPEAPAAARVRELLED